MQQFLEGTIVGPVIEVHIVKDLDNFELEIAVPPPNNPIRTSCVLIFRGNSRFVDELHIANVEHYRTSAELLSEHAIAGESEPCLARAEFPEEFDLTRGDDEIENHARRGQFERWNVRNRCK